MPVAGAITSWQFRPDTWKNGDAEMMHGSAGGPSGRCPDAAATRATDSAPRSIAIRMKWRLLRCDSSAPLGRPVVPLVNRMRYGSSSSISTSGSAARLRLERGEVVLEHDDGQVGVDGLAVEALDAAAVAEQDLGRGEAERVRHLGAGPPAVHRDGDRTERGRRPERDRVLDAVRGRDRDPVALGHAVLVGQRTRARRDRAGHVGVRERPVGEDHVRPVAVALRGRDEQVAQVALAVREHLHLDAEHVLGRQLERRARAGERVADRVGQRRVGPGQPHAGQGICLLGAGCRDAGTPDAVDACVARAVVPDCAGAPRRRAVRRSATGRSVVGAGGSVR